MSVPPLDLQAERLAAGFAAHVETWARRRQFDEQSIAATRAAALAVSRATSGGHVCVTLDEIVGGGAIVASAAAAAPRRGSGVERTALLRAELLASGVVGTPEAPGALPLVLDADGRLYLHRYFDAERRLARRLVLAASAAPPAPGAAARKCLQTLFANGSSNGDPDWQMIAVALALRQRLVIVSGGPGTGKTTTLVALLACLLAEAPGCRIALAAPTGKAAARMTEAIRERAGHLPPALRQALPAEASTIHRLLGVTAAPGGTIHHAGNRLAIDVLVVDEASMLDLALAARLLEAVPDGARIVLLGDKDQLAAVESGAVFSELGADPTLTPACRRAVAKLCGIDAERIAPSLPSRSGALRDTTVWFTRNHRFAAGSPIGRLAGAINQGDADGARAVLGSGDAAARWLDEGESSLGRPTLEAALQGHDAYLAAVQAGGDDAAPLFAAFTAFRILAAVRSGPRGVAALNEVLTRHARRAQREEARGPAPAARSPWYRGRPVMVLRNDYALRLFNGDVGIAWPDASGALMVHFARPEGGLRSIAPARLPEHETAYAMTVHKAQGSEFDRVLVVLPARPGPVLTRELLYTAVTRARHGVLVSASAAVLAAAIEARATRQGGLHARLAEAAREPRPGQ